MGFTRCLACASVAATLCGGSIASAQSSAPADAACADAHFLIGEWEVKTGDGRLAAEVVFEAGADDCYVVETWEGRLDGIPDWYALVTYSGETKNWGYLAASSNPGGLRLRYEDGTMHGEEFRFSTAELANGQGRFSYFKLPDGRLRELSVLSSDDGKTWETEYEFFWQRKN